MSLFSSKRLPAEAILKWNNIMRKILEHKLITISPNLGLTIKRNLISVLESTT
jgi:hypothetical protein